MEVAGELREADLAGEAVKVESRKEGENDHVSLFVKKKKTFDAGKKEKKKNLSLSSVSLSSLPPSFFSSFILLIDLLQRAGGRCRPRRVKQGGKKRKRQEEVEEGEEKRCRLFSSSLSRCPLPSSTTLSTSPKPRSRPTPARRGKKLVIFFLYVEKSEKRRKVEEEK